MKTFCFPASAILLTLTLSASAATAPRLQLARVGSNISITWDGSGILETAGAVTGPWRALPEVTSPYQFKPGAPPAFFRVNASLFAVRIIKTGEGKGSVTSEPAGIHCGETCVLALPANAVVTLIATSEPGSVFAGWSGDGTGTAPCVLTMNGPRAVTATFSPSPPVGLVNGDFEQGPGVGWTQKPGQLIYRADELSIQAYQGEYVAWIGYAPDNRHSATIGQAVTLPNTWPLYLHFALWLYSDEICDAGYWDTFGFYVNGEAMVENPRLCHGNTGGDGWRLVSMDLSPYAGQTVVLAFEISSTAFDPLASVAVLDDLRLSNIP